MIRNISDVIEQYIKEVITRSRAGMVELQRSELAEQFQCVPSQINYVIATRFSPEHGYIVESKRGGGGYIRIREIQLDDEDPMVVLMKHIGASLAQRDAEGIVGRLERETLISSREAAIIRAALRRETLQIALPERDELRSRLLLSMMVALFAEEDADPAYE